MIQSSIISIFKLSILFTFSLESVDVLSFSPTLVENSRSSYESIKFENHNRRKFLVSFPVSLSIAGLISSPASAFDGGVGGLGKVKPKTGIVFRDSDTSPRLVTASGSSDTVVNELVGPDGTIALVSFKAPWPLLQSSG